MTKSIKSQVDDEEFKAKRKQANLLLDTGKFEEALPEYQKLIEINPDYAEGYCNIGLIQIEQNRLAEAEKNLMISIQKDPELLEGYYNLGLLYQRKGSFAKALIFYKEVVTRNKQDSDTFLQMGFCALSMNNKTDARAFFQESFRQRPNSLEAGAALASILIEFNLYEDAEEVLRISLISYPEEISLHFSLGMVLRQQNKPEQALAHFKRVVSLDENHAQGFYYLADCCFQLDLLDQAESFFAIAYKLNQSSAEIVLQLGKVYEKQKKMDKLIVAQQQWVEMVKAQLWQLDPESQDQFNTICQNLIDYYARESDINKTVYYQSLMSGHDSFDLQSKTEPDDYNISLLIDD